MGQAFLVKIFLKKIKNACKYLKVLLHLLQLTALLRVHVCMQLCSLGSNYSLEHIFLKRAVFCVIYTKLS